MKQSCSYAYVIMPNKSKSESIAYANNPNVKILANSSDVQVVSSNSTVNSDITYYGIILYGRNKTANFVMPTSFGDKTIKITSNYETIILISYNKNTNELIFNMSDLDSNINSIKSSRKYFNINVDGINLDAIGLTYTSGTYSYTNFNNLDIKAQNSDNVSSNICYFYKKVSTKKNECSDYYKDGFVPATYVSSSDDKNLFSYYYTVSSRKQQTTLLRVAG